ncbi:hypothetical protein CHLRE_17g718700v5 [Chlamydomonas reinhardtii]|uniref:Uncharacterized protein n=1 Tax=Chlamydomonas reinhardtii TaxID=3055 RepID=A0A2K3CQ47_CHLRE|nr:uncharacterized protein CHLRE_17g718700v5 [Chlamydomonas reinhardtii]PNW70412.1 hypothetical protein CHLRE_17g718700v5 [Chlamydomonas reinhardtii]
MYFGHKTALTFACWVLFAVCFIQGCIWLPISGVALGGCKFCRDRFKETGKANLSMVAWNLTYAYGLETGCIVSAFEFSVFYPQDASGADAPNQYYNWCINSGPLAGLIGGGVAMAVALFVLPFCCLCASPPLPKRHQVSFIGPLDLSPDAYARTTSAANVAQQQQQLKYANAAAASSYGSQLGLLAAAGASPYASAANSPLGVRAVASPQLLLSPRVTLSPAGSLHSPRSPGAGAGYVIYSNPAAVYPLNSAGGYPPAIQAHGSAATTPPGFGDGASPAAEDAQLAQQQQQLVQQQQLAQQQPQLQQQDQLEHMQAQQRQQMQAFMQQQMQGAGGQPMLPHPHLGGRTYH